ncbi:MULTISPECIES: signal peptidase I [Vagococcus]|uniref:Signal peptidase I n=1 Tax=Vagococcus fluvialis bH819 TaxID=1255619 RepID=A0A1X6WLR5_9ENTE|nr:MULTISPECIES: signal peptidase I [Vagococcus]SLM85215.1 Signal peptidase I [Vagococcus fluvialis bH819]HCM88372.1 signal peptidase I [Vagococcus sp.]
MKKKSSKKIKKHSNSKHNKKKHRKGKKSTKRKVQLKRKKYRKINPLVFDILIGIFTTLILFFIVGSFFFSIDKVRDNSMYPLMRNGDKAFISKNTKSINRFDIVAFESGNHIEYRRVIGLPGEMVKYADDYLTIDDQKIDEKFIMDQINEYGKKGEIYTQSHQGENGFQTKKIPKDFYLVLGDNRPYATDSRQYGLIAADRMKGKVNYLLFPIRILKE